MHKAEEYTYRVFWSDDDQEYVATVAEFPSLSCLEDDQVEALVGLVDVVRSVLEDMAASAEMPPTPLGKRVYSGKFALRMTPEQHRRVAIEASEQGVSINHLLTSRL